MPWDDLHESKEPEERFKNRGGGGPPKTPFEIPQIKVPQFKPSMLLGIILLLLVVWIIPGTFYFVEPDEEGVVTTFGKFTRTTSPGLHFKFPSPIEHAATPKITQVRRAEIGFRAAQGRPNQKVPAESLMLTGDQNIVDIHRQPQEDYAEHCRLADIRSAPLRDCLSYYNGHGNAAPGSLAYYGGGRWHKYRIAAQDTLDPYCFGPTK